MPFRRAAGYGCQWDTPLVVDSLIVVVQDCRYGYYGTSFYLV